MPNSSESQLICMPHKMSKSKNKEGEKFRSILAFFLLIHILFIVIAFVFVSFFLGFKQLAFAYLMYCAYMTLSRLITVLYIVLVVVGSVYGLSDMWTIRTGGIGLLLYVTILSIQMFGVYFIGRRMIEYSGALSRKAPSK